MLDGDELIGRVFRVNAATELWWWGVSFMLTDRKSYGTADTLDSRVGPGNFTPSLSQNRT